MYVPCWSAWDRVSPLLLIRLPANVDPGRQQPWLKQLGPCHPHGRLGVNSQLKTWPNPGLGGCLESNSENRSVLWSLSLKLINVSAHHCRGQACPAPTCRHGAGVLCCLLPCPPALCHRHWPWSPADKAAVSTQGLLVEPSHPMFVNNQGLPGNRAMSPSCAPACRDFLLLCAASSFLAPPARVLGRGSGVVPLLFTSRRMAGLAAPPRAATVAPDRGPSGVRREW